MGMHEAIVAAATSPAEVIPADIVDFIGEPSLLKTEVEHAQEHRVLRTGLRRYGESQTR